MQPGSNGSKTDRTVRFCIDFQKVNEISTFDAYPKPRVDELLEKFSKAKFITTLDLTKGYWQVPLSLYWAFSTPTGLYQFK